MLDWESKERKKGNKHGSARGKVCKVGGWVLGGNWGSCGWHESGWMEDRAVAGNWRPVMGTGFICHPLRFMMTIVF